MNTSSDGEPGVRDHFFRNHNHQSFFSLFQSLYPWNGKRWLQVNINALQTDRLIDEFGFPPERVAELTTSVGNKLLEEFTLPGRVLCHESAWLTFCQMANRW